MGSFKANGREQGPKRSRDQKQARRRNSLRLEWLENRLLLSGGGNPYYLPTTTNVSDVEHGPMANMGSDLINVYESSLNAHGNASGLPAKFPLLKFQNNSVMIGLNSYTDFPDLKT